MSGDRVVLEHGEHVAGRWIDGLDPSDGDGQFKRIDQLKLVGQVPAAVGA